MKLGDLDGDVLLEAIAHVESSGGANNWPRLEAAYMPKGVTVTAQGRLIFGTGACFNEIVRKRWLKWGVSSAGSYGPWQILYHTAADLGFAGAPWELWSPETVRMFVIARLRKIEKAGARTVEEFADAWNSGNFRDTIIPSVYINEVKAAYTALSVPKPITTLER